MTGRTCVVCGSIDRYPAAPHPFLVVADGYGQRQIYCDYSCREEHYRLRAEERRVALVALIEELESRSAVSP